MIENEDAKTNSLMNDLHDGHEVALEDGLENDDELDYEEGDEFDELESGPSPETCEKLARIDAERTALQQQENEQFKALQLLLKGEDYLTKALHLRPERGEGIKTYTMPNGDTLLLRIHTSRWECVVERVSILRKSDVDEMLAPPDSKRGIEPRLMEHAIGDAAFWTRKTPCWSCEEAEECEQFLDWACHACGDAEVDEWLDERERERNGISDDEEVACDGDC
jgi:hypothetical protein